jgi:D-glycero-D-manno-heptose 1,7-bisphosphate phosphatase
MPSPTTHKPAIFLDRDGVIVENRADYVKSIAEVQILPGALAALAEAARLEARIVIVTNQSPVGRGLISEAGLRDIHAYLHAAIAAAGGRIDGWYYCPHRPDAGCNCRKPKPGMLLDAARDLAIDLPASVMVGDAVSDMLAGHAAGTQAIMVGTGRGVTQTAELSPAGLGHVLVVPDLATAIQRIAASSHFTKTPPDGGGTRLLRAEILPHNPPADAGRG